MGPRAKWRDWVSLVGLLAACSTYNPDLLVSEAAQAGTSNGGGDSGGETNAGATSPVGGQPGAAGKASSDAGGKGAGGPSGGSNGGGAASGGAPAGAGGGETEGGAGGQPAEPLPTGDGSITHERWLNVPGSSMEDFPTGVADETTALSEFKAPATDAVDYADRISGYLVAPLDGNYRFWIACDDNCELWLSTDDSEANEVLIASLLGIDRWTDPDEWGKFASQESRLITLEAGKRYRVEAFVKQGIGGSNLSVGWLKPGQSGTAPSEVIPGTQLSP